MGYGLNSSKKAIRALCRDPTVGRIKGDTRNSGYGLYNYYSLVLRREWGNELRIREYYLGLYGSFPKLLFPKWGKCI